MGFVHYDSAVKHIQELLQPQWHTWGRKAPCNIPKMRFVLINMKRFIFLCQSRRLVCGAVRILWLEVETRSLFTVYVLYMCDFILLSKCEWQLICCFSWTNIYYAFTLWSINSPFYFIYSYKSLGVGWCNSLPCEVASIETLRKIRTHAFFLQREVTLLSIKVNMIMFFKNIGHVIRVSLNNSEKRFTKSSN